MRLTPARTDLPAVGDEIAIVHSSGQWYVGRPLTVTAVDPEPPRPTAPRITVHTYDFRGPFYGKYADALDEAYETHWVFGRDYPLEWNLVTALSDAERKPIAEYKERLAATLARRPGGP